MDRALEAAQVAADGRERVRLAGTLRRLAPAVAAVSHADAPRRDAEADFAHCLLELSGA